MKNTLKYILCFTITVIFLVSPCYSQEKSHYKCSYQLDMQKDTVDMKYFRQEIYILQIGEKITKGFVYQKFYNDSLAKAAPKLYRKLFSTSIMESIEAMKRTGDLTHVHNNSFVNGGFASDLYKDYKKNEIRVRDNISVHSFVYKDELKPQEWEILNDTATILGYQCQKAQCDWRGRVWEAWFTLEIPISEGPWKFYGLPGLITKLHDTGKHYSFELIGFQEAVEPIDTKISKDTQKIDRMEFIRTSFGDKKKAIVDTDMAKVGLSNSEPIINRYDYIERDYK